MKTTILIFLTAILFVFLLSMVVTLPGENYEKNWRDEQKPSKIEQKAVEEIKKKQHKSNREREDRIETPSSHSRRPKLFTKKESDDEQEEDKNIKAPNYKRVVSGSSNNQRAIGRH